MFDDIAGLLLEGFVIRIPSFALRSVPEENSSHALATRAAVWRAQMLHLNLRARDDIFGEGITRVGSVRRLRKGHRRVHNAGILRTRKQSTSFLRKTWANTGNKLTWNSEDDGASTKRLLLPVYFGFDLNSRISLLDIQGTRSG